MEAKLASNKDADLDNDEEKKPDVGDGWIGMTDGKITNRRQMPHTYPRKRPGTVVKERKLRALRKPAFVHVPFRESKLTRYLVRTGTWYLLQ